jgi:hypothetical protein
MSWPSIPSPASSTRYRPAIVLVEVLVGAAIIATVAGLFLMVLVDSAMNIARSRDRTEELMIAGETLRGAQASWPYGPRTGTSGGYGWSLSCQDAQQLQSKRLALIACESLVARQGGLPADPGVRLHAAWFATLPPP